MTEMQSRFAEFVAEACKRAAAGDAFAAQALAIIKLLQDGHDLHRTGKPQ